MAVSTRNQTKGVDKIVDRIIGKGSTVTKAEALSVIEEFEYAIAEEVKEGNNVVTELFKIYPSVSGVFTNEDDSFDPVRHAVKLNLVAGSRLKSVVSQIEVEKVKIISPEPVIKRFTDLKSNVVNESFTPGQIVAIKGSYLKFDEEDPSQGVFFVDDDKSEVRVSNVVKNMPSELMFFVPDELTTGIFQVEVRVVFHKSKTLKKTRLLIDLVPA